MKTGPQPDTPLERAIAAALAREAAPAQTEDRVPAPAKPRKYRNRPTEVDGVRFDSRGEARRWAALRELEAAGAITSLRRQVKVPLVVNEVQVAALVMDFAYVEAGAQVWEDFKSPATRTRLWRLKAKLLRALTGQEIRVSSADSVPSVYTGSGLAVGCRRPKKAPPQV